MCSQKKTEARLRALSQELTTLSDIAGDMTHEAAVAGTGQIVSNSQLGRGFGRLCRNETDP